MLKNLFKIADPFLNFYFKFVTPNRSLIELGMNDNAINKVKGNWTIYVSAEYEDLCRRSIPFLLKMQGDFLPAKRYWNKDVEIDIMRLF